MIDDEDNNDFLDTVLEIGLAASSVVAVPKIIDLVFDNEEIKNNNNMSIKNEKQKYIFLIVRDCENPIYHQGSFSDCKTSKTIPVIANSEIDCYKKILSLEDSDFSRRFGTYKLTDNDKKVKALSYLDTKKYIMVNTEINNLYIQELDSEKDCLAKIINKCKRFALADKNIESCIV